VQKIAVHPDHRRQGHGRHLLTSLGSKLAILGPSRIVAEVPENLAPACGLFSASGYVQEALLTDFVLHPTAHTTLRGGPGQRDEKDSDIGEGFVIPVTIDDLAANGLLGEDYPKVCWMRAVETLTARKGDIAGLAVASDERIEACILYIKDAGPEASALTAEVVSLRTFIEDGGARLKHLLFQLRAQGMRTLRIQKVHPAEISKEFLETLGFRPAGRHLLYAATAQSA
jgi:L-amino acid N-acyltransferase YncA